MVHLQWVGIWFVTALILSCLNYLCNVVKMSFGRMRKKYIEDNDEQDPQLIAKVAPFYKKTQLVLDSAGWGTYIFTGLFALSLAGLLYEADQSLAWFFPFAAWWIPVICEIVIAVVAVIAYWLFTILIPSSIALVRALPVLASHTWTVRFLIKLFGPLAHVSSVMARRILKMKKIPFRNIVNFTYTEDEIRCIVEESNRGGRLNALENTLIKNSFDFFDLMVDDVMIPRNEMIVIDFHDSMKDIHRIISSSHHNCYPVCVDDKDHILGFIFAKDFLEMELHGELNIKKITKEILTVPEVMPAPSLLQLMKNRRIYQAIVVDEYGGTVGLVTLEDLVEELIGQVAQTMDTAPGEIVKMKNGTYEFDGTVILEDVSDSCGIDLDDENGSNTIGGFVFAELERIPKVGDSVKAQGWKFTVLRMDGFRIVRVKAEPVAEQPSEAETQKS